MALKPRNRRHVAGKIAVVCGYGEVGKGSAQAFTFLWRHCACHGN